MIYLNKLCYKKPDLNCFPFNIPVVKNLNEIVFNSPVTILVGENGSGKSTILEALAAKINCTVVGGEDIKADPTLTEITKLADYFQLSWKTKTRRGFFMRSEDFFNFTRKLHKIKEEMKSELERVEKDYKNSSKFARMQARAAFQSSLYQLENTYRGDLDKLSHGESFLQLFQARFKPGGLYLLDEPEVPLSPISQYSLVMMIKEMVDNHQAQFVIATHSPVLMSFPKALIFSCDEGNIHPVSFDDLEQVNFLRSFLNNPLNYLRHI
ncbi:MAG: AAA family ATPase [bacterium]